MTVHAYCLMPNHFHLLDYIEKENNGDELGLESTLEIYNHEVLVDYPRNEAGDIIAMVHKTDKTKTSPS